jgi:Carboxypeptidase regulatory-like domain
LARGKANFLEEGLAMRGRMQVLSLVIVVAVLCLGMVVSAWPQSTNTGNVAGTVTDTSGAVVPGVTVTLSQINTSSTRTAVSNDAGKYFFANVDPGQYSISLNKQGFATTKSQAEVKVGTSTTLNLTLQVGASTTTVEVQATGTELQTMNATIGNTLDSVAIDNLPTMGRDAATFLALQPGVSPDGSVAGAVVDQTQFTLDGGNNTNDMDGSMSVYTTSYASDPTGGVANQSLGVAAGPTGVMPTPIDSIEEFKVNTTGQTADFNSSAGAEVKMVTKRGTDAYHGTAYEYYRDNNWSSNSWDNNYFNSQFGPGSGPLPTFHYNRFGGAVGGPLIPKAVLGGKTYFFFNYEGFRFPNSRAIDRNVPSQNLRNGILTDPKTGTSYNLKTVDPLGIGLNPLVQQLWSKYEPQSNASCVNSLCDGVNILGFHGNVSLPLSSKFSVVRVDHDFSSKWHLMSSWRYYNLKNPTTDQVDIGGFFKGDTLGVPASQSSDPQQAWYLVAGLTTNITTNTTNDIHYSFLRNWWAWNRAGDTIQLGGIDGALELASGESATQSLAPYNVNAQQTRTRFWDGHDQMFRDDVSMLKGNHLFQLGGTYEHNFDYHQRTDNGGGINYQPVYQLGQGSHGAGNVSVQFCTKTVSSSFSTACGADYAAALGIVSASQTAFTRSGPLLTLNPPLTPAFDQSTIPFYNVYFSDTWHMKPTFTLTYGLGWTLEMPPTEKNGKQVALVGLDDQFINGEDYLAARKRQALLGQVYNPIVGYALTANVGNSPKYPYNPYYGSFSPRLAVAWNPNFDADTTLGKIFGHNDTVVRGGYGRIFGRLNGVDLVLVPLLGTGLIQPVQCFNNLSNGNCGAPGTAISDSTAFRVGINGPAAPLPIPSQNLVQPDYPGVNAIGAGAGEVLDPNFRPNVIDSFTFSIQRQLSRKYTLEAGYIGRRITHEYLPVNLNAVPYMMNMGGQQFKNAYANMLLQYCGGFAGMGGGGCAANRGAVTPQKFFETALSGTGYCTTAVNIGTKSSPNFVTPGSCTDAVVLNEGSTGTGNLNIENVWSLWSDLDSGGFNFPRTMQNTAVPGSSFGGSGQLSSGVASNMSIGYGNYNALFATLKMADWKGVTLQSNFTWSKALGTDALVQASSELTPDDPFNIPMNYGVQAFDRRLVYTMFMVYSPPFFKGQSGLLGRALGGWTIASTFSTGTGQPIEISTTNGDGQAFGAGDAAAYFDQENAVPMGPIQKGHAYYNTPGSSGIGTGGLPVNIFKDPAAAFASYRNPILGVDTRDGGFGVLTGVPFWNVDMSVKKNIRVAERVSVELQGVFANVFNHNQFLDPQGMGLGSPGSFGNMLGSAQAPPVGGNRQIEIAGRVRF